MKKLESLNNSLFDKLENRKVNDLAKCIGGAPVATTTQLNASHVDAYDLATGRPGGSAIYLEPGVATPADIYR